MLMNMAFNLYKRRVGRLSKIEGVRQTPKTGERRVKK